MIGAAACVGCCLTKKATSWLCSTLRPSVATRVWYTFGFVVSTALGFALHEWGYRMPNTVTSQCGKECWAYLAVMRISLAMVIYHAVLTLLVFGVRRGGEVRASLQNGFWPIKFVVWLTLIVLMFYVPDSAFYNYHVAAIVFSALFIIMQSFVLVDFAWAWAQHWIDKWEETSDDFYKYCLIGFCGIFYVGTLVVSVLMYMYFGPPEKPGCGLNSYFVTMNLVLSLIHSIVAVLPVIQEHTPKSGLFQSSLLSIYTTYLTASALASEPSEGEFQCGLSADAGDSLSNGTLYLGVLITFIALGYSAFSSGSSDLFSYEYTALESGTAGEDGDEQPDDEHDRCVYNYSFFHLTFMAASFYMAMVLNDWSVMTADLTSPNGVTIEHGFGAMWVKIISSWVCALLYLWTLVAPLIFPDRDFSV